MTYWLTHASFVLDLKSVIACAQNWAALTCGVNAIINIVSANYGRTKENTCMKYGSSRDMTTCHAADSLNVVKQKCEGESNCTVKADNEEFGGDPCPKTNKYLLIRYQCQPSK